MAHLERPLPKLFFRPVGARSSVPVYPGLAPWAAFLRRCAAGLAARQSCLANILRTVGNKSLWRAPLAQRINFKRSQ